MGIIVDRSFKQGSPEWFSARIGNPGASSLDKIITSTGKISTSRGKYLYQMAGEILAGEKAESFSNDAMNRGTELEPKAREVFSFVTGHEVEEVGLVYPDELKRWHVSPDGLLVGQKKGLEIKCPLLATHVEYLDKGNLPTKYKCQVQGSLLCTEYDSWFFVSYYPGIKPLIVEVERDEKFCCLLKEAVEEFCFDMGELVERLRR